MRWGVRKMPTYTVAFELRQADTLELPAHLLAGGRYRVKTEGDGSVEISGNRDGLLYLAEVLVRCAIGGFSPGFHVHVPLSGDERGPNLEARPELTIYCADPRGRHLAVEQP